ncbi:replication-relaxation family protein [Amycolatopsis albispora]|uniref:replication-relaxation family protein n=1 Tax=Amycolatopsis albispora TaxID=1804986 RepID=UPI001F2D4337|nr:replication-relaxation family protein [Amycolatopsis albispora]
MELLAEHRVLTTGQITAVEFSSVRRAQDRMRQLRGLGVVFSFRDSYATGGTSESRFALGYVGARMMAARRAVTPPTAKEHTQRLERLALWPKLAHHLGVNDFFCRLAAYSNPARPALAASPDAGALTQWWSERRCADFFWTHQGVKGEARIRPDGYGCWESGGRVVRFFLEYDTGTESLRVVARKISGYGGFPSDRFGVLLFSFHSARRETAFRAGLGKMLGGYDAGVVIATTARDLPAQEYPAGPVWALWSAREPCPARERLRLADLPERGPRVRHHTPDLPYGRAAFAPNDPAVFRLLSTDAA